MAESTDKRIEYIQSHVTTALRLKPDRWARAVSDDTKLQLIYRFLETTGVQLLVFSMDLADQLQISTSFDARRKAVYFVKLPGIDEVTLDRSLDAQLMSGDIAPAPLPGPPAQTGQTLATASVLAQTDVLIRAVFLPLLRQAAAATATWPAVLGADLVLETERLASRSAVLRGAVRGDTVLPVIAAADTAAAVARLNANPGTPLTPAEKDLAQALESSAAEWLALTSASLTATDTDTETDPAYVAACGVRTPPALVTAAAEWARRAQDLRSVHVQLRSEPLQAVAQLLHAAGSRHATVLNSLTEQVGDALASATAHAALYSRFDEQVQTLRAAADPEVPMAPGVQRATLGLLGSVAELWRRRSHDPVILRRLLRGVLTEVAGAVGTALDPAAILASEHRESLPVLARCIAAAESAQVSYQQQLDLLSEEERGLWPEYSEISAHMGRFIVRLKQLHSLFVSVVEFGQLQRVEIGGVAGALLSAQIATVYDEFTHALAASFSTEVNPLACLDAPDDPFLAAHTAFTRALNDWELRVVSVAEAAMRECTGGLENVIQAGVIADHDLSIASERAAARAAPAPAATAAASAAPATHLELNANVVAAGITQAPMGGRSYAGRFGVLTPGGSTLPESAASALLEAARLLTSLSCVATLPLVAKCLASHYRALLALLDREIRIAHETFRQNQAQPPIGPTLPPLAGRVEWARSLVARLRPVYNEFAIPEPAPAPADNDDEEGAEGAAEAEDADLVVSVASPRRGATASPGRRPAAAAPAAGATTSATNSVAMAAVVSSPEFALVQQRYIDLRTDVETYVASVHAQWAETVNGTDLALSSNLLRLRTLAEDVASARGDLTARYPRAATTPSAAASLRERPTPTRLLDVSFSHTLSTLLREVRHMRIAGLPVPARARSLHSCGEVLQGQAAVLRGAVEQYNYLQRNLTSAEKPLFATMLETLDAALEAGLSELTWASPAEDINNFAERVSAACTDVYDRCVTMKEHVAAIEAVLAGWASTPLLTRGAKKAFDISTATEQIAAQVAECAKTAPAIYEHLTAIAGVLGIEVNYTELVSIAASTGTRKVLRQREVAREVVREVQRRVRHTRTVKKELPKKEVEEVEAEAEVVETPAEDTSTTTSPETTTTSPDTASPETETKAEPEAETETAEVEAEEKEKSEPADDEVKSEHEPEAEEAAAPAPVTAEAPIAETETDAAAAPAAAPEPEYEDVEESYYETEVEEVIDHETVTETYECEEDINEATTTLPAAWRNYQNVVIALVAEGLVTVVTNSIAHIAAAFAAAADPAARTPALEATIHIVAGRPSLLFVPALTSVEGESDGPTLAETVASWVAAMVDVGAIVRDPSHLADSTGLRARIADAPAVAAAAAGLAASVDAAASKAVVDADELFAPWRAVWVTDRGDYMRRFLEWGPDCSVDGSREAAILAQLKHTGREADDAEDAKILEDAHKHRPTFQDFDATIAVFTGHDSRVSALPDRLQADHLWVDMRPARQGVSAMLVSYALGFTEWLEQDVTTRLNELQVFFNDITARLSEENLPAGEGSYEELTACLGAMHALRERTDEIDRCWPGLRDTIVLLRQHDIVVARDTVQLLEELPTQWAAVKRVGYQAKERLAPLRAGEVRALRAAQSEFSEAVLALKDEFRAKGPFTYTMTEEEARTSLAHYLQVHATMAAQKEKLNDKERVFELALTDPPILDEILAEIGLLEKVWDVVDVVRAQIREWETAPWTNIDTPSIEAACKMFTRDIRALPRACRAFDVFRGLDTALKNFLASLPLVADLKHPSLRPHHWRSLSRLINMDIDMTSRGADFTLGDFLAMGLHRFVEDVETIVSRAAKEGLMEGQLLQLEQTWATMELAFTPGRGAPVATAAEFAAIGAAAAAGDRAALTDMRLGPLNEPLPAAAVEAALAAKAAPCAMLVVSEELMETLEDHQVQVQNMVASRYGAHFMAQTTQWTADLGLIDAAVNAWLDVQKSWQHLEPIFIGSEDIRSQLPEQSRLFEGVDAEWRELMAVLVTKPRVLDASHHPGLVATFTRLGEQLVVCEKALADYLENKRMEFPRFFFISSTALLDALSKSQSPLLVEPHLGSVFDGMRCLEWRKDEDGNVVNKTAIGMHSKDGEYVEFVTPVVCDGPVEVWLARIEREMRLTLRALFAQAVQSYAETPRSTWILRYPSQVVCTSGMIMWSTAVEAAFARLEEGSETAMRDYARSQNEDLVRLVTMVRRDDLSDYERKKIVNICTLDVHSRDVVASLIRDRVDTSAAFAWQSQLRPCWTTSDEARSVFLRGRKTVEYQEFEGGDGDVVIRLMDARCNYRYEYLGNVDRLVITPLTDRCYITLIQSLHLNLGGAPAGPAGTGKTETVKDLAKALGNIACVFNCSAAMEYTALGNIFRGLSSTGAAGCFATGTQVRMADGSTRPVEDIVEGDLVMGADGAPRRVVHLFSGTDTMYDVVDPRAPATPLMRVNSAHRMYFEVPNFHDGAGARTVLRTDGVPGIDLETIDGSTSEAELLTAQPLVLTMTAQEAAVLTAHGPALQHWAMCQPSTDRTRTTRVAVLEAGEATYHGFQLERLDGEDPALEQDAAAAPAARPDPRRAAAMFCLANGCVVSNCFDEFNRISVEVLSVVATQVKQVLDALRAGHETFEINSSPSRLIPTVGIFITMNPGYAGRTELPENIKALFRPVSMVVPDYALIAEIMLMSQGFVDARELSKKFTTLYALSKELLSKADHYDWGMRAIKSVLVVAGTLKRADPERPEQHVLMRALRDFNMPKIITEDIDVFLGLIGDLFPSIDIPRKENPVLTDLCKQALLERSLQPEPVFVRKCVELQELLDVRHSVMVLGAEGVGKSTCWQTLARVYELQGLRVQTPDLNPKVMPPEELYGFINPATREWRDGLFSNIMRSLAEQQDTQPKWVVLDGDLDPDWVESCNTVMDDNKVLTLASNERIPLRPHMRLIFEVSSLRHATPATVSRAGILFINPSDVGWAATVQSWADRQTYLTSTQRNHITVLFSKYFSTCYDTVRTQFKQITPLGDIAIATTLCRLLEGLLAPPPADSVAVNNPAAAIPVFYSSTATADSETGRLVYAQPQPLAITAETDRDTVEIYFVFAAIWAFGGAMFRDQIVDYREAFSKWWRQTWKSVPLPSDGTVFDYRILRDVDSDRITFRLWADDVAHNAAEAAEAAAESADSEPVDIHNTLVLTPESQRLRALLDLLVPRGHAAMFVGPAGSGKTALLRNYMAGLPDDIWLGRAVNLSFYSTANDVQNQLEECLEKKAGRVHAPPGRLRLLALVDDLNMPQVDVYGTQSPSTILRQFSDYGHWYDREKLLLKDIRGVQLLAAMNPSAGSFTINPRLQRHFSTFACDIPSADSLHRIYTTVLSRHYLAHDATGKQHAFSEDVRSVVPRIVDTMLGVHARIVQSFQPTAVNFHYVFNMRDLSNVAGGLLTAAPEGVKDSLSFGRLLVHEIHRTYSDRLVTPEDLTTYTKIVADVSTKTLVEGIVDRSADTSTDMRSKLLATPNVFANFAGGLSDRLYSEVPSTERLSTILTEALTAYNEVNPQMDLVLFSDAMEHVSRIARIVARPRGNALLIGVGGSGKQSLARLASFIAGNEVFQITITSSYSQTDFRADMQKLFRMTGVKDTPVSFLFTDSQIINEHFLVDINDLLSSGRISGLFAKEEEDEIIEAVRNDAKNAGVVDTRAAVWDFFLNRVRANLHTVLCFSPVGDAFRQRARKFPAIFSCTQIDWFHPWPRDALISVAERFIADASLGDVAGDAHARLVSEIAVFMADAHGAVHAAAAEYYQRTRRRAYTTPKSYLELISLYRRLLKVRRADLIGRIERLDAGLVKLETTERDVGGLQVELEKQRIIVAERKTAAEELLVQLGVETADVDKQRAAAEVEQGKCDVIAAECSRQQEECEADLSKAEPAIIAAEAALDTLNKPNLTELKAFTKPADDVHSVMKAVFIFLSPNGRVPADLSWNNIKKMMGGVDQFLKRLKEYDKDHIPDELVDAVKQYTDMPGFNGTDIKNKSAAAAGICEWVRNIYIYNQLYRVVQPKRERLAEANAQLDGAQKRLAKVKQGLARLNKKLAELQQKFEDATSEKNRVIAQAKATEQRLELAQRLVSGLASEKVRWAASVQSLSSSADALVGDLLMVAAFVSYIGPFDASFRSSLVATWANTLMKSSIPSSATAGGVAALDPTARLADAAQIAAWSNEQLPTDHISVQNAAIITNCDRWPLLIDPQLQCADWLRARHARNGQHLEIVRFTQPKWLDKIANAMTNGHAVLLENVGETLDAILDPLLGRNFIRRGRTQLVRLGDKEVEYDPRFRLYIQTRIGSPHFGPELQAQTTLVNFTVTSKGLEDQLLALVVNEDVPELEQRKNTLMTQQNDFRIRLKELEDDLLMRLSAATGDILGDVTLVENLETTKATSIEIAEKSVAADATEAEINLTREKYRPVAARAALLYFLLNSLDRIDTMYKFSLTSFINVFFKAIRATPANANVTERAAALVDAVTRETYKYTVRGLFVAHKLLFATQLTLLTLQQAGQLVPAEIDYLLRAPKAFDIPNPFDGWMPDAAWQSAVALAAVGETFARLPSDLQGSAKRWQEWVGAEAPEMQRLPQDWKHKTPEQRLCIIRALRPDRMIPALRLYVAERIGAEFVADVPNSVAAVFPELAPETPLFFILSPGVDPMKEVEAHGLVCGHSAAAGTLLAVSLGQGQELVAERALEHAAKTGAWVFLQNVHLMQRWLPQLEKLIEQYCRPAGSALADGATVHPKFRLFLSAEPTTMPQGILQASVKVTNEPPSGVKENMLRALSLFTEADAEACSKPSEFKTILFVLCFFHAILLERRRFGPQGFTRPYPFSTGDLRISANVLANNLDSSTVVPWEDLNYMFGEILYGGHISCDIDRRLVSTFLAQTITPRLLDDCDIAPDFPAPPPASLADYSTYVDEMLPPDAPRLFGMHANAEIGCLTTQATDLFTSLYDLQGGGLGAAADAAEREAAVRDVLETTLAGLPEGFVMSELYDRCPARTPFASVCLQECERMNTLLSTIRNSLRELDLGLRGDLTLSPAMEATTDALYAGRVPAAWRAAAYPSLKGLSAWLVDLAQRCAQLHEWSSAFDLPKSVWISGLFNPQSFLTAVLQTASRANNWPLDKTVLTTDVTRKTPAEIAAAPRDGAYIHGCFVEGARFDDKAGCLRDARLKEMHPALPVVHVRAVLADRADSRDTYDCPVYLTKARTDPEFVWKFGIKVRDPPSKWILAGVALLLSDD